jgi:type II secretory pathway component PulJ
MHEQGREAMRAVLTAEATRRFGAERAAALARDIEALAADLAQVAAAELPAETEPAFFLLEETAG